MTTQTPEQNEQLDDLQAQGTTSPPSPGSSSKQTQASAQQPVILPPSEEEYFYFEEEAPDLGDIPFVVTPFQPSNALPTFAEPLRQPTNQISGGSAASAPPPPKKAKKIRPSLTMISIIVCVVVIIGFVVMNALAQAMPSLQQAPQALQTPQQVKSQQSKPTVPQQKPSTKAVPKPTNGTTAQGQNQVTPEEIPQHLPNGWLNAGLQMEDAIQALRTAATFNDREMSLDYRSNATFTAATFVMTQADQQRFKDNDVRVINNDLFEQVENTKLIRLVVNSQPTLINFTQVGQQQFAWVDVAFQLWTSSIDPKSGQRIEGKEIDPTTNQPRIHHMMVLLLHVPPQNAGDNPAMGGTGWLVSNYGLDLTTPLTIVQPA